MIPFNRPAYTGREDPHVFAAMRGSKLSGDGEYGKRCEHWFEENVGARKALLVPSCTQALELAALLVDIKAGDEVIMPSYTFVSTANAFALRGAKIVFVDVDPNTMNLDPELIEDAITERTKVVVPVHYAGIACDMTRILEVAKSHGLLVIEDAAQGVGSTYRGRPLGTFGQLGAYSFHDTKNYTSGGEGGLLLVNEESYAARAEIVREKGTNRSQFFRGMVDKYTWVDVGSSYLPSELQAAFLFGQLEVFEDINSGRMQVWKNYLDGLTLLAERGLVELPHVPSDCRHNAHMFYLKTRDLEDRTALIEHLKANGVQAAFHYVPLHSSPAGRQFGRFHGDDRHTTRESARLVRLPLWYGLSEADQAVVIDAVSRFYA